jgi:hypothetical protein
MCPTRDRNAAGEALGRVPNWHSAVQMLAVLRESQTHGRKIRKRAPLAGDTSPVAGVGLVTATL